ncbi:primosomal protein N' [Actinocorallia longicatena]|uniref:Probable replication restart protein PriA n=1 Tax=Actinocorallia longicatena TaxID=111803 RepID=A0ABP6QB19_9ACTN
MNEDGLIPGLEGLAAPEKAKPAPKKAAKGVQEPAAELPVARIAVEVPLPHLDRTFDYLVPDKLADKAVPGCRVRVRFSGKLMDGFLLERLAETEHEGRMAFLERVISPEPVLTPEIAALARELADRYAGTLADVLRLAVPPRHARAESGARPPTPPLPAAAPPPGPWTDYPAGPSFLTALAEGKQPRAVWTALPGHDWPATLARAAHATLTSGRGTLIIVADGRDAARVDAALTAEFAPPADAPEDTGPVAAHVTLTAELGPEERYRRWLRVVRGQALVAVGTRAAMFAPVRDLGLVVLWDDGDDVHADPHAPYPHAREVLALRAHRAGAGALIGGLSRTSDATQLVAGGWAHGLTAARDRVRQAMPRVQLAGEDWEQGRDQAARAARLSTLAFSTAREALKEGPVLVQVPRRGYLPALACQRCRELARCTVCAGPLAMASSHAAPFCKWCGHIAGDWQCPECRGRQIRAVVVGAGRTAEELGRAFPGVTVRTSGRDGILASVGTRPELVVSTPGAEPVAEQGYAAALLLDGWALLGRADLRANEEALRKWLNAAGLVRPQGQVVLVADGSRPVVQAVVRWDPVTFAERELAERAELSFPPAVRMASLTGTPAAIRDLLAAAELPPEAEVLGPVPIGSDGAAERALVRVPRTHGAPLSRALKQAQGIRSAKKAPDPVRVQVDPLELI